MLHQLSLAAASMGYSLAVVLRPLLAVASLAVCGAQALRAGTWASVVAAPRLYSTGSIVVAQESLVALGCVGSSWIRN